MSAALPVSTVASATGGRHKVHADSDDEGGPGGVMPAKPGRVKTAISTAQVGFCGVDAVAGVRVS